MTKRAYDVPAGFETSSIDDPDDPVADNDFGSKGYNDRTYTPKNQIGGNVATIAALKALVTQTGAPAARILDQQIIVSNLDVSYKWAPASTGTSDDDLIVRPSDVANDGLPGRWLKSLGASTGGSGSGSSLATLQQKLENEHVAIFTEDLDKSLGVSGAKEAAERAYEITFLKAINASDTQIFGVINALPLDASDPNTDDDTDWTASGNAINKGLAGSGVIGADQLKFDKSSGGTVARITRTFSTPISINPIQYAVVDLPSITNLTRLSVEISGSSPSNYRRYDVTADIFGNPLHVGQNIIRIDLRDFSGTTTGGSAWGPSEQLGEWNFDVVATSGQTYSNIKLDSICSGLDGAELGFPTCRMTLHDNSNREAVTIDSASAVDGVFDLVAGVANSYDGGFDGASIAKLKRTTTKVGNNVVEFDDDSSLSGDILTTQEIRMSRVLPETATGSGQYFADIFTRQNYKTLDVNSGDIDVEDFADDSADMVSGNKIDIFRPYYVAGKKFFEYVMTKTITGSSWSADVLTITMASTTGIQDGDVVVKRHLSAAISTVAKTANEAFSAITIEESATALKLFDIGINYPNPREVIGHYLLGASKPTLGIRNKRGYLPTLTVVGSPNFGFTFKNGQLAVSGLDSTNYLKIANADSADLRGSTLVGLPLAMSFWAYLTAFTGSARAMVSKGNAASTNGWTVYANDVDNTVVLRVDTGVTSVPFIPNTWNHIVFEIGPPAYVAVNAIKSATTPVAATGVNDAFTIGCQSDSQNLPLGPGSALADLDILHEAANLTQSQIEMLFAGGKHAPLGFATMLRHQMTINGLSGQKISLAEQLDTTTVDVRPQISKSGIIL